MKTLHAWSFHGLSPRLGNPQRGWGAPARPPFPSCSPASLPGATQAPAPAAECFPLLPNPSEQTRVSSSQLGSAGLSVPGLCRGDSGTEQPSPPEWGRGAHSPKFAFPPQMQPGCAPHWKQVAGDNLLFLCLAAPHPAQQALTWPGCPSTACAAAGPHLDVS